MNASSDGVIRMFAEIPPIPVPDLLDNNHAPSLSEARLIQATLSGVHHDLWRLNNNIGRVQTLLLNLMRNRDLLCAYYHRQRTLLSPVRRIPPEILSEIFLACLTVHHEEESIFPARKDVLLFGQICRYWRDVAFSTSRLWSTLKIDLRAQNMDRELEMAPTWLARSGCAPLTLALCSYNETPQTHPITDVILAHAPRWYILALDAPLSIIHSFRGAKGRIPCLHRLMISDMPYFDPSPMPQSLDAFEIAPELHHLDVWKQVSVQKPEFPWAQLREIHLSGHRYTVDDFLQRLHNSPNLVTCQMDLISSQSHLPRTIVQNSNLRELYVDVDDLATLFEDLVLPALISLYCIGHETWPQKEFLSFLHRSSFSLQKLVVSAEYSDDYGEYSAGLVRCLPHMPNLLELELLDGTGAAVECTFWGHITHRLSSPCLVPKLRRIKVTRYLYFDYEGFAAMVESRWRMNSAQGTIHIAVERIQNVEVCLMVNHEEYDAYNSVCEEASSLRSFALLREFRAEGLDIIAPDIDADYSSSGSSDE